MSCIMQYCYFNDFQACFILYMFDMTLSIAIFFILKSGGNKATPSEIEL